MRDPAAAGTCSPAWAINTSSPAVFSATVLPPVFGPVTTSTVVGGTILMSTGTGSDGSGGLVRAAAGESSASVRDGASRSEDAGWLRREVTTDISSG